MDDIHKALVPLQLLDLKKCTTVGQLVKDMGLCSFGARMLGEVASTLTKWVQIPQQKPLVLYDDDVDSKVHGLLQIMRSAGAFSEVMNSESYVNNRHPSPGGNVLCVGNFTGRFAKQAFSKAGRIIFINNEGKCKPGQVRDGFFPDVVFSDPALVMPVINAVLQEELGNKCLTVSDFFDQIEKEAEGLAAELLHGTRTMLNMIQDKECKVFLTLSGAMTVAQMSLLICEMIDNGLVQYVSSTGALMAHGLVHGLGLKHYKYDPRYTDQQLAAALLNRITDTLEPEENFDHIEKVVDKALACFDSTHPAFGSIDFHREIGRILAENYSNEPSILASAFRRNVPISVPAFPDSEIGNDVAVEGMRREDEGRSKLLMDLELDTRRLIKEATSASRRGIISIGGGVPRNNTQNVAPLVEIINGRLGRNLPPVPFRYGVRIDPTPMYYGNLSGCTYSEGGSWRKMDLEHGQFSEIHADATIVWPFMLKAVLEQLYTAEVSRQLKAA